MLLNSYGYIGIFSFHLFLSCILLVFCSLLLKQESEDIFSVKSIPMSNQPETSLTSSRSTLGEQRGWFDHFMYVLMVVLFHIVFVICLLVDYQIISSDLISSSRFYILVYVLGYTMRRQGKLLTVSNFVSLFFEELTVSFLDATHQRIQNFAQQRASWKVAQGLFEIPMIVTLLWNTALFFLTTNAC